MDETLVGYFVVVNLMAKPQRKESDIPMILKAMQRSSSTPLDSSREKG